MNQKDYLPKDLIPKPCHENWHAMTGDERKRHCDLCNTKVTNLTGMSFDEIAALKEKNGGQLCGRFESEAPVKRSHSLTKPLVIGSGIASLALASCSDQSQQELQTLGMICEPPAQNDDTEKEPKKTEVNNSDQFSKPAIEPEKPINIPIKPDYEIPLMGIVCPPHVDIEPPVEKPVDPAIEIPKPPIHIMGKIAPPRDMQQGSET